MSINLVRTDQQLNLPKAVQQQLSRVIQQLQTSARIRRASLLFSVVTVAVLLLVGIDFLYEPTSIVFRLFMLTGIAAPAALICVWLAFMLSRRNVPILDAAWTIESARPEFEERLTSAIELLNHDRSRTQSSGQLIDAMLNEADQRAKTMDSETVRPPCAWPAISIAGCSLAVAIAMFAVSPETFVYSLANWAMPWRAPVFPPLAATVSPGHTQVVEGDSAIVEVLSRRDLNKPTLELFDSTDDIRLIAMTVASERQASITLPDLSQSLRYRIRSGSRVTRDYAIEVLQRPVITSATATISTPEYTKLGTATVRDLTQPIAVPAGSNIQVQLTGDQDSALAVLKWNDGREQVSQDLQFFFDTPVQSIQSAELRLLSERQVESEPVNLQIEVAADAPPEIEIISPVLKHLELKHDHQLELQFTANDDFGVASVEVHMQWNEGADEPRIQTTRCEFSPVNIDGRQSWIGQTACQFGAIPAHVTGAVVWMQVTDNRPETLGGAQSAESERIVIDFSETAVSPIEQEVLTDSDRIQKALDQSASEIRQAVDKAEMLTETLNAEFKDHNQLESDESELRESTEAARQKLDELAEMMADASSSYEKEADKVRQVRDENIAKAIDDAFRASLSDDLSEKQKKVAEAAADLKEAEKRMQQLAADLEQRSKDLRLAAKLDELAGRQNKLAEQAEESKQESESKTPEEDWKNRQQELASQLEAAEKQTREARQQRLDEQAAQAEQLAQEIEQIEQKQQASNEPVEQASNSSTDSDQNESNAEGQNSNQKASSKRNEPSKQNANSQPQNGDRRKDADSGKNSNQQPAEPGKQTQQQSKERSKEQTQEQTREQIKEAAKAAREKAEKLAEQISDARDAQQMAKEAGRQLEEAEKLTDENPKDAEKALRKATESMRSVCEACKSCSNCMNPGGGSNTSSTPSAERIQQAQKAAKNATEAATTKEAAERSATAARELAQLAKAAADQSGLKKPAAPPQQQAQKKPGDSERASGSERPGSRPTGARSTESDDLQAVELRGGTGSDWTRPRTKQRGSVVDKREAAVPEAFRGIVDRYFEELSRQPASSPNSPADLNQGVDP